MKSSKKTLITITVSGILTGSTLAALADTSAGKPFEGVVVENVVVREQFPMDVETGSIQVKDGSEMAMADQAKITSSEAARIAEKALPGKAVETRLDEENGYLVWEVETIGDQGRETQLKIDAGNGRLLAVEADEKGEHEDADDREDRNDDREDRDEEKHSSWKFWDKDGDRDDQDADRG